MMNRRTLIHAAAAMAVATWVAVPQAALAADEAPDALVKRLSVDVLETLRKDKSIKAGDVDRIMALVDKTIMPHVNFRRMTAASVGPGWRKATPEQQARLQDEFKTLLVRTYAGALKQVNDQTIRVRPVRMQPGDKEVLVRSEIVTRGEPIQLDYRLEKAPGKGMGWRIYNLNVMGIWMVETYREQFQNELKANGVQGLIDSIVARNKANAAK